MVRNKKILPVLGLLLLLANCGPSSQSGAVAAARITPEEQGFLEYITPKLDFIVSNYVVIVDSAKKYSEAEARKNDMSLPESTRQNQEGIAAREASRYFSAFQNYINLLEKIRDSGDTGQRTAVAPDTMVELLNAIRKFDQHRFELPRGRALTQEELEAMKYLAQGVYDADQSLAALWGARPADYSYQNYSQDLTVQFGAIPFKLDIVRGEVKVSFTQSFGPVKFTAAAGPTARGGIKTLILQNGAYRRFFAVGGKPIRLYIPESILETNGDVMTITALE